MHNFEERRLPIRDRLLRTHAARLGLRLVVREGIGAVTLTRLARELLLPGDQQVSERTLRRRYRDAACLIFGFAWWLPDPADVVAAVVRRRLAPIGTVWPEDQIDTAADVIVGDEFDWPSAGFFTEAGLADPLGPCVTASPLPMTLRELVIDLDTVLCGHVLTTGFAACLDSIHRAEADDPEVRAWLCFARETYADTLAAHLAPILTVADSAVIARVVVDLGRRLEPQVSELAKALGARSTGPGDPVARAGNALDRQRRALTEGLTDDLSTVDRIRGHARSSTVRFGGAGPYGALPYRPTGT